MWPRQSNELAPLTKLTSINKKFNWKNVEQDAFKKIKWILAHDSLLPYLDFNKQFKIHTDASALQLGSVISHKCNNFISTV